MSIRFPARLESRALASLRLPARHARLHDEVQLGRLVASMRRFGWTVPLLVTPDGEVVAGAARVEAGRRLGLAEVPVVPIDGLSPAEIEAYRIADNRLAELARWDEARLGEIVGELQLAEFDLEAIGFGEAEIAALIDDVLAPVDDEADRAAPPPPDPITRLGDLWQLGPHRLVCGDATKPETFACLFAGDRAAPRTTFADLETADLVVTDPPYGMTYEGGRARAALVVTDPPYGMSFGAGKEAGSTAKGATVKAHGVILGDDKRGDALVDLVADSLSQAKAACRPGAAFYVCFTWRTYAEFQAALTRAGLEIAACIVWDKGSIGLGHQHYRPQHEFIFYCRGDAWFGGKAEGDVWQLSRGATGDYVHPTQKPVGLLERAIRNSSRPGDVILDLFGGSGSTLIACERLGRKARLVELDPKYCDAIVARWERLTGGRARRIAGAFDGTADGHRGGEAVGPEQGHGVAPGAQARPGA